MDKDTGALSVDASVADGTKIKVVALTEVDGKNYTSDPYLVTVVGQVVKVEITGDKQVKVGETLTLSATVTVDGSPVTTPPVTWTATKLDGSSFPATGDTAVTMDNNGNLTVGKLVDPDTKINVTASYTADGRTTTSEVHQVTALGKVVTVTVTGGDQLRAGTDLDLSAAVDVDGNKETNPALTWAALDDSGKPITGVTIANGKLTVADTVAENTKINVTATYTLDGKTYTSDSHQVTVLAKNALSVVVNAAGGATTVEAGQDLTFTVDVSDSDGAVTPGKKTWSMTVKPGTPRALTVDADIDQNGKLSVGDTIMDNWAITVKCAVEYTDKSGNALTAEGSTTITVNGPDHVVIENTETEVTAGSNTLTMTAKLKRADDSDYSSHKVTWSLSGNDQAGTTIDPDTGVLTVDPNETVGGTLTITATAVANENKTVTKDLTVAIKGYNLDENGRVDVNGTFSKDGQTFRVLYRNDSSHEALVIREQLMDATAFGSSNVWRDSPIRTQLNGTYYNSLTNLKQFVKRTDITTRATYNGSDFITTQDYVFLLSEADVYGTANNGAITSPDARDFTVSGKQVLFTSNNDRIAKKAGASSGSHWWLRSPAGSSGRLAGVPVDGSHNSYGYAEVCYLRPAFWLYIQ